MFSSCVARIKGMSLSGETPPPPILSSFGPAARTNPPISAKLAASAGSALNQVRTAKCSEKKKPLKANL